MFVMRSMSGHMLQQWSFPSTWGYGIWDMGYSVLYNIVYNVVHNVVCNVVYDAVHTYEASSMCSIVQHRTWV